MQSGYKPPAVPRLPVNIVPLRPGQRVDYNTWAANSWGLDWVVFIINDKIPNGTRVYFPAGFDFPKWFYFNATETVVDAPVASSSIKAFDFNFLQNMIQDTNGVVQGTQNVASRQECLSSHTPRFSTFFYV